MFNKFILSVCSLALLVGCKKDDNNSPVTPKGAALKGSYLLETAVKNPDGQSGASYLQVLTDPVGKVDNAKGLQLALGAGIVVEGNDVYTFDSGMGNPKNEVTHYTYDPATAKLTAGAKVKLPAGMTYNLTKVSATKAYMPIYTTGEVWIVNPQTMEKTGTIELKDYAHGDQNPDPSYGFISGNHYFLALNQINSRWQPYDDYQQSDVLIINTQTDKVEKVISEKTLGLTFPTRPYLKDMLFADEAGDIYVACAGYFGYNPQNTKTGFLCIPKAATVSNTAFDTARSWDISTTTIAGTNYKPAAVQNCLYLGGGKVIAYVAILGVGGNNPYTAKNLMAVIVDLKAKTLKKIEGIPLSDGFSVHFSRLSDGKIAIANFSETTVGIYSYDPTTDKAELALSTTGNPYFFHQF